MILIYSHTPAGIGIRNSKVSRGEDENGNKYIRGRFSKYILKGNRLYKRSGAQTPYTVKDNGNVVKDGKTVCNIFTGGRFKEESTSYLMMVYSNDNGKTWSAPRSLNKMVKRNT